MRKPPFPVKFSLLRNETREIGAFPVSVVDQPIGFSHSRYSCLTFKDIVTSSITEHASAEAFTENCKHNLLPTYPHGPKCMTSACVYHWPCHRPGSSSSCQQSITNTFPSLSVTTLGNTQPFSLSAGTWAVTRSGSDSLGAIFYWDVSIFHDLCPLAHGHRSRSYEYIMLICYVSCNMSIS